MDEELRTAFEPVDVELSTAKYRVPPSDGHLSRNFIYYFAALWSIFSMVYIGCITFGDIPKDNVRFADTIVGFLLGTIVATLFAYFYGSTKNSQRKDEVIGNIVSGAK